MKAITDADQPSPNKQLVRLAQQLQKSFRRTGRVQGKTRSASDWAQHLAKLVDEEGYPLEQVLTTLTTFLEHFTEEGAPRCYSGSSIRDRFVDVLAWAARYQSQQLLTGQGTEETGRQARAAAQREWDKGWPHPVTQELLTQLAHATILVGNSVRAALPDKVPEGQGGSARYNKVIQLLDDWFANPQNAAGWWLEQLHQRYGHFDSLRVDLARHAGTPDNPDYVLALGVYAASYYGREAVDDVKRILESAR